MWKSWGDTYDIVPWDKNKRPRKIKGTNILAIALAIVCYLTGSMIFVHIQPEAAFWRYVPPAVSALSAIICLLFFFLKWKKNDEEQDLLLIFEAVIFIVITVIALP